MHPLSRITMGLNIFPLFGWYYKLSIICFWTTFVLLPLLSRLPYLTQLLPSLQPIFANPCISLYPQAIFLAILVVIRTYQNLLNPKTAPPTLEALKNWSDFAHGRTITSGYITTRDGVQLAYKKLGTGPNVILAANGLGCSAIFGVPIMDLICTSSTWSTFTIITWDYRGLFESTKGSETLPDTYFSIRDNAVDGMELLNQLGYEKCYAMFGYSTGVQVALEFASCYPHGVDKLILMNGTHGHLISSFLQPLFRIPFLNEWFHTIIMLTRSYVISPTTSYSLLKGVVHCIINAFRLCLLKPVCFLTNSNYEWFVVHYVLEFFCNPAHSVNYMKYPASLDCHSSYHLLHTITQQTVIVSGMLDVLTPSYTSYEMAAMMPNARVHVETWGTHFCLLEFPEKCGRVIKELLDEGVEDEGVEVTVYGREDTEGAGKKQGKNQGKKQKGVSTGIITGGSKKKRGRSKSRSRKSD
jgi:pimeloyl-ACP methyl ester carboxylesterase